MTDSEHTDAAETTVEDGVARGRYEWSSTPPSTGAVEAIAAATGDAPTAFAPLYESLDPDALDELVRSAAERSGEDALVVSFTHAGCEVTVRSDGSVLARPAEES
jgi:hypothetical protein